jgi:DNA-binding transcriptional regulator GbsR (MarR family)
MKTKPGQVKIINALANASDKGLTFTELREQTGLSNTALSNYLNLLCTIGAIRKDQENKQYLLASINLPFQKLNGNWQKAVKNTAIDVINIGRKIQSMPNKEDREKALENLADYSFHTLSVITSKIIWESILQYGKDKKKIKNKKLAVLKSQIIKEGIEDWIIGLADALASALILNIDVSDIVVAAQEKEVKKWADLRDSLGVIIGENKHGD